MHVRCGGSLAERGAARASEYAKLAAMYGRDTSTVAFDKFAPSDSGITVETGTNEDLTARYNVLPRVLIITASEKGRRFPAVTYRPVMNR